MKRLLAVFFVLFCALSSGCVSLFSDIHNETHHHHHHGNMEHVEELEHRVNELEEDLHRLLERLEEDGESEEEDEEEER